MRFFRRGVSSAIFVTTIADTTLATITAAELSAGTDLSAAVQSISGFESTTNRISQPVLKYKRNPQISGSQTFGDAQMVLQEDDGNTGPDSTDLAAAMSALAEDETGFMVLCPTGTGASKKVEIWPVEVGANNRDWSLEDQFATYTVQFAITGEPKKDATIGS